LATAFDRVAKEGVLFTHAYTAAPQCSPCRAAILTGRNIWQLEEAGTHNSYFPKKFQVFPDILEANGYFVGYTGKGWGPGNWKDAGWKRNPAGPEYSGKTLTPPASGISNKDYAGNFEDFLKQRPKNQPFFFWFGCHEPHRKYNKGVGIKSGKKLEDVDVPAFLPDNEEIRSDILDYAYEIEWFDQHFSRMIQKLEEIGELDNTLIVVTSDNGMPFPKAKANLYEFGVHMPLAIRWGDKIKGGRVVDDFVSFIDLAPTFLEAAGLKPTKEMTGKSLMPILLSDKSGQVDPSRDRVYVGRERHSHARYDNLGYPARAVRTKEFLYIWNIKPDRWPAGDPDSYYDIDGSPTKTYMIEHRKEIPDLFEAAFGKRPEEELYEVEKDLACMHNLANDPRYKKIKEELKKDLHRVLKEQGDPRVLGYGDIFESYPRFGSMRGEELGGFGERGKYNEKYRKMAEEAMKKLGIKK